MTMKPTPTTDDYVEACAPETGLQIILWDAQSELKYTEKQLRSDAEYIIRKMQAVIVNLDEGYHVNSLGELQGSAQNFDRLCAAREMQAKHITALEWAIKKDAPAFEVVAEMVYDPDDDTLVGMCGMCGTRPSAPDDDLCERCGA